MHDRPFSNANFRVDFGRGAEGFAEVVLPVLRIEDEQRPVADAEAPRLVLRRGVTGARDLWQWWSKVRRGKAPKRRTVKVELLAEDGATPVMTWVFRNARPCSIGYSPLRANEGGALIETIEIAFDTVEVA